MFPAMPGFSVIVIVMPLLVVKPVGGLMLRGSAPREMQLPAQERPRLWLLRQLVKDAVVLEAESVGQSAGQLGEFSAVGQVAVQVAKG